MRHRNDRHLRRQGRDIHLVPIEFIYLGPDTFRHSGSKFLLLNTNVAETRQALKTARETENSYVLLSADICIDHFEAVCDLDNTRWLNFWEPRTVPQKQDEDGLVQAEHLLKFYSWVYHINSHTIDNIPLALKDALRTMGLDS